jgi:hypothetical protein
MRSRSVVLISACALLQWMASTAAAAGRSSGAKTSSGCRDDIVQADGFKIRSVQFLARFGSISPPAPGTPYSPVLRTTLTEQFHDALSQESIQEEVEGATEFQLLNGISAEKGGQVGLSFVDSCVRVVPDEECIKALGSASPKCVDVVMRAYSVRIDTANPWSGLLDNSRANAPTFFRNVPAPLLALNPKMGAAYDRKYGIAGTLNVSSNLFDLRNNLSRNPLVVRPTRLDVSARGSKSLQNDYYTGGINLGLSHQTSGAIDSFTLSADVDAQHVPLGGGNYVRTAGTFGGSLRFHFQGPLSRISVGANYSNSSNRYSVAPGAGFVGDRENRFALRFIANGGLAGGFSRIGVWVDGGSPETLPGSYRRAATMLGYAKEFQIADHQAISLEVLLGGGNLWGTVPLYSRYFGGNSLNNFLYESTDSGALSNMPEGPLIRSLGTGQATTMAGTTQLGGTSYWHANLNVVLPVPKWSKPLIPNVTIEGLVKKDRDCKLILDADGNPIPEDRTLGQVLKSQGSCSKNTLSKLFQKQGLTPDAAKDKAEAELKSINSILTFLADRANLVSVKPLVLFDAARLYNEGLQNTGVRYGVGGGFQLTVVVAKFEAGYVYGVRRFPGDPPGNFVVRLVFQNLF